MTLGLAPKQADLFGSTAAYCEGRVAPDSIYGILHRECRGASRMARDARHFITPPATLFDIRDLYIDVLVPTDGRHQRLLDLDEFADAIEAGQLDVSTAIDGLRRWQRFLDRHLHAARDPHDQWTDFPPRRL